MRGRRFYRTEEPMVKGNKLELGIIISLIGLVLLLASKLVAYGGRERDQDNDIKYLKHQHEIWAPKVDKIDVVENDVAHIKKAVDETKLDVKELLKRTPK
jgi:hypothetical protein